MKVPQDYFEISPGVYGKRSTFHRASCNNAVRVHAVQQEPVKRLPLDAVVEGEEARWYGLAERFEITFIVYAVRPCDYDGYDIKALQDFCISAGIIPDDGWKTLSGRIVSRKAATKAEEKTVIEIRPCLPVALPATSNCKTPV